jgi:hypothetical protein
MNVRSKPISIMCRFKRKSALSGPILALLLIISSQTGMAQSESKGISLAVGNSSVLEDSLNDGPHVYWQDDSTAIVFYLCKETVVKDTVNGIDTLRFRGFCADDCTEYAIPLKPHSVKPHVFDNVPRILAVSDVHGEFDHLVEILTNSGVIDDQCKWTWGDGHLVVLGDVFDRGEKVTECLWLIYRLEMEAERAGGCVHYILGNHELMVLRGDNRYIHQRYLDGIVKKTRIEHQDLYGPDMELGRWLRSKHTAVKLNRVVFVHAGLTPLVMNRNLGLGELNQMVRGNIDLRSSQLAFNQPVKFLFGGVGPFWYRGYHYEMEERYPQASVGAIDSLLSFYDAQTFVVGHTELDQASALYEGRVMAIDVPVEELGGFQAFLWKVGKFYRVTGSGELQPLD